MQILGMITGSQREALLYFPQQTLCLLQESARPSSYVFLLKHICVFISNTAFLEQIYISEYIYISLG